MFPSKVITRVLIPGAAVVSEATRDKNEKLCRPSELPIYSPECPTVTKVSQPSEPGIIEGYFATARRGIATVAKQFRWVQRVAEDNIQTGVENADWLIKYLGEEENYAPKAGAIAVGGLTGFIFGLRGGRFKRIVYASAGALAMASVCYPKEASEYSKVVVEEGKKYATIGYNFVYGVKKGDPPLELPALPTVTVPSSVSEVWATIKGFGQSKSSVVAEPEEKVIVDRCAKDGPEIIRTATTEVTVSDPAVVVSNLHEQCHCPIGKCVHNPSNPTIPPGV